MSKKTSDFWYESIVIASLVVSIANFVAGLVFLLRLITLHGVWWQDLLSLVLLLAAVNLSLPAVHPSDQSLAYYSFKDWARRNPDKVDADVVVGAISFIVADVIIFLLHWLF